MRVAFCGGGTGGHVVPGLAVLEELQRQHPNVEAVLLGTGRAGERALVEQTAVTHVDLYGQDRSLRSQFRAMGTARSTLRAFQPDVVVGLGGYASIAGVTAAKSLGLRCLLLEQNAVAGRATDLLTPLSEDVLAGLPSPTPRTRWSVVGTPVRAAIACLAAKSCSRVASSRALLVLGGSQGSRVVSEAVLQAVRAHPESFRDVEIAHQCPAEDVDRVLAAYHECRVDAEVRAFFDDIPQRLGNGPLVVSRAGGTTIAELACAGVPSILIPHARALRDHQQANADVVAAYGGAVVIRESERDRLISLLPALLHDDVARVTQAQAVRQLARPEAALAICRRLLALDTRQRAA